MFTNFITEPEEYNIEYNKMHAILTLCLIPLAIIVRAFAIATMWNMIVPQHFGLSEISYPLALCLGMLVTIILPQKNTASEDFLKKVKVGQLNARLRDMHSKEVVEASFKKCLVEPLMATFIVWIVTFFL